MKRFLLFGGDIYEKRGGWGDFLEAFEDVASAEVAAVRYLARPGCADSWTEVVDLESMKVVFER